MRTKAEILILKFRMMEEELEFLRKIFNHAAHELGKDMILAWYENEHGKVPKKYNK
jgi:hypothetical protein